MINKINHMERVSAIIIRDKKLLLVTGYDESFYWTPGGKINIDETREKALERELHEELGIKSAKIKPYFEYETINELSNAKQKVYCFLVEFEGHIKPSKEITKFIFAFKEDIEKIKLPIGIKDFLIPKIIKDNLI